MFRFLFRHPLAPSSIIEIPRNDIAIRASKKKRLIAKAIARRSFKIILKLSIWSGIMVFKVGDIVNVTARMGPGENFPGGVARITAKHGSGKHTSYDVKYVVGRSKEMGLTAILFQLRTMSRHHGHHASPQSPRNASPNQSRLRVRRRRRRKRNRR